jgi:hypothetical protein
VGQEDARIVDDAAGTGAVHKPEGGGEKDPRLEARIGRVVLDKEFPGVGENQPGTLSLDFLPPFEHMGDYSEVNEPFALRALFQ